MSGSCNPRQNGRRRWVEEYILIRPKAQNACPFFSQSRAHESRPIILPGSAMIAKPHLEGRFSGLCSLVSTTGEFSSSLKKLYLAVSASTPPAYVFIAANRNTIEAKALIYTVIKIFECGKPPKMIASGYVRCQESALPCGFSRAFVAR